MNKQWIIKPISEQKYHFFHDQMGLSSLTAKVLASRMEANEGVLHDYLNPSFEQLHDPFLLSDMDKAATRTILAMKKGESILLYGDYDVDGVCSTSMVYNFFQRIGYPVSYFVPDRFEDGYGITMKTTKKILDLSPNLMITVDCGISAVEEISHLQNEGVCVIVTDHHECPSSLPPAYAVVNPQRHDDRYPFDGLSGAGVAFKLICALCLKLGLDIQYDYLDLAALGTVADVMPLQDENRSLVHFGLEKIRHSPNRGMKALLDVCNVTSDSVSSYTLGFMIGPRINAGGRLGDSKRGVQLFTTSEPDTANNIALALHEENKRRQDTEQEILAEAIRQIESEIDLASTHVLVVAGENWHHGVIGIVASRLVERYYRPTLVFSIEGDWARASGRSVPEFNLYEGVSACSHLFERYGGHEMAVGITVKPEALDEFRKMINAFAKEVLSFDEMMPKIIIDAQIDCQDVTLENIRGLDALKPFGQENPSPLFAFRDLTIETLKKVGNEKHLKLTFRKDEFRIDAIGFHMANLADTFQKGDIVDVVCSPELNEWNQKVSPQLRVEDLKPGEQYTKVSQCVEEAMHLAKVMFSQEPAHSFVGLKRAIPMPDRYDAHGMAMERSDVETVYKVLRSAYKQGMTEHKKSQFIQILENHSPGKFDILKTESILQILAELKLIHLEVLDLQYKVSIPEILEKSDLEDSVLYRYCKSINLQ